MDLPELQATLSANPAIWITVSSFVGACMASFIGVLAARLPHSAGWRPEPDTNVSLMTPSRCEACGTKVPPLALVPVLGWLLYRGRCGRCAASVPWIYPVVEALTAIASGAVAFRYGPSAEAIFMLALTWGVLAIAWIDWREAWIPDRISAPLAILGLLASPLAPEATDRIHGLAVGAGLISIAFLYMSWRRGENHFAGGDIMFCAAAGAWLGLWGSLYFLLVTCAIYAGSHLFLHVHGSRWEPADSKMRDLLGDQPFLPMGPSIAISLLGCAVAMGW